jgi:hypothetical protein
MGMTNSGFVMPIFCLQFGEYPAEALKQEELCGKKVPGVLIITLIMIPSGASIAKGDLHEEIFYFHYSVAC